MKAASVPASASACPSPHSLAALVVAVAERFEAANLAYGHGTSNAFDEAAWLCLWALKLPLDTDLALELDPGIACGAAQPGQPAQDLVKLWALVQQRIDTRKPLAYLTREAWLHGLAFYVDERCIIPRSPIATLLVQDELEPLLVKRPQRILDLCTGNASLAIFAALHFAEARVDALDISHDALAVAAINCKRHRVEHRVRLLASDGMDAAQGPYDLILCNPPYVPERSMHALPPEYRAEPSLALAGGVWGMDFIARVLPQMAEHMSAAAQLVLEVGFEATTFMQHYASLEPLWLDTAALTGQANAAVCMIERRHLVKWAAVPTARPTRPS